METHSPKPTARDVMVSQLLGQKNHAPSRKFQQHLRTRIQQEFKTKCAQDKALNLSTANALQGTTRAAGVSFTTDLRHKVIHQFCAKMGKAVQTTKRSVWQILGDFWEAQMRVFQIALVPSMAALSLFLILPPNNVIPFSGQHGQQSVAIVANVPALEYNGILHEESDEDVVYFAMMDGFDDSLENINMITDIQIPDIAL